MLKENKEIKKKEEKKKKAIEKKITQILTDEKLSAIKSCLEKDHAIDCLCLLYMNKGRWGQAKKFLREKLGKHIADGTFRSRMMELEMHGLATHKNIRKNPKQKQYLITDFGEKVTQFLINFFMQVK
ncbi:hypothetical protein KAU92_05915 [Candidatus Bathyarchaeota archaeon]|nr:hypothetical protein [Candidatus Bathyarchaeota archaeon]